MFKFEEKNYIQSRYHFLHSLDAQSFAHMMVECHLNFGYPSEYDLFLAQSVLQYISVRNLPAAEEFFFHYVKVHPAVKKVKLPNNDSIECFESPLINFLLFLIKALKKFVYFLKGFTYFNSIFHPLGFCNFFPFAQLNFFTAFSSKVFESGELVNSNNEFLFYLKNHAQCPRNVVKPHFLNINISMKHSLEILSLLSFYR